MLSISFKWNWKLGEKRSHSIHDTSNVQFFHQSPNIIPKYRLSNASNTLSRQMCRKKKKRQSMIAPQRNSNRSSARYVDYRENLIFFSLPTILSSARINPPFFFWRNGTIRPWRVTGSGGRRVTRLAMPAGKGARFLLLSKRSPALHGRNNTACELVRAWRRNGTKPVAASASTHDAIHGKLDFFLEWSASLSRQPRSMRFSCLSTRLQSGYSQGYFTLTIRKRDTRPANLVHHLEGRGGQWTGYGMVKHGRGYVSGLWVTF